MITLRTLPLGVALVLAAVAAASAQPPIGKVHRIGLLEHTALAQNTADVEALQDALRRMGYVEGQNLVIDYRSADGQPERYPELAADLVRSNVDVIMTRGAPAALAASKATSTIQIVMTSIGEPISAGVVALGLALMLRADVLIV